MFHEYWVSKAPRCRATIFYSLINIEWLVSTSISAKIFLKTKAGNYLIELVILFFFCVHNKIIGANKLHWVSSIATRGLPLLCYVLYSWIISKRKINQRILIRLMQFVKLLSQWRTRKQWEIGNSIVHWLQRFSESNRYISWKRSKKMK